MSKVVENFTKRARKIHGDLCDYSKAVHVPGDIRVDIICKKHGIFNQTRGNHIKGSGCPECAKLKTTIHDFISRAEKHHGDFFDYSNVKFNATRDKVEIICPAHGSFLQQARDHMRGIGCLECSHDRSRVSFETFLERAKSYHGDTYEYDESNWTGERRTIIKCKVHGEFSQFWYNHTKGDGCQKCSRIRSRLSLEVFIERAKSVHGDVYDYSKTKFSGTVSKIIVTCVDHGDFELWLGNHLSGRGCKKCKVTGTSKGEEEVAQFIESLGYEVVRNDRDTLGRKEIDILIPDLNIGFEYNGTYWHSDEVIQNTRGLSALEYHGNKIKDSKAAGVTLYYVWESDWVYSEELIKESLKDILSSAEQSLSPKLGSLKLLTKTSE